MLRPSKRGSVPARPVVPRLEGLEERVVPTTVATIREATGANIAAIQATVNQFRNDLGDNNANVPGSFGGGRRQIDWDGAPDAVSSPNAFPADFFNANVSPRARGAVFFNPAGGGFRLSNNDNPADFRFGDLNPTYTTAFSVFSAERLFTPIGNNITDVEFFIPGTSTPATVTGFGAVFTDVDVAGSSSLEFFDVRGNLLTERDILATPGNGSLSFLGITFNSAAVSRVRITSGNGDITAPTSPDDITQGGPDDLVVLDDFIYGEPVAITPLNPDSGRVVAQNGQLTITSGTSFAADLTGGQEVPNPVATNATGTARLSLDPVGQTLHFEITVRGLDFGTAAGGTPQTANPNDDVVGAHFHNAARGVNGPIVFGLINPAQDNDDLTITINPDGSTTLRGTWEQTDPANTPLSTFIPGLLATGVGQDTALYLNIHTVGNPTGAIRGQITGAGSPLTLSFRDLIPGTTDPDAPVKVGLSAGNGLLTLASTAGLTFTSGDGSDDRSVTFTGTVADINNALDGLTYTPATDFVGGDAITVNVPGAGLTNTVDIQVGINERSDGPGMFDPATGLWYLRNSPTGGFPDVNIFAFGAPGWTPVAGDYNNDGVDTIGVVDRVSGPLATWFLRNSNNTGAPDAGNVVFGLSSFLPVVGDWDGDGIDSIGMFDPASGTWFLRNNNNPADPSLFTEAFAFGPPGALPVVGDWDGNGTDTVGVFDPASGTFFLRNSNSAGAPDAGQFAFGLGIWRPVAGDWDGNGTDSIGVVDPTGASDIITGGSVWFLRNTNSSGAPDFKSFPFGAPGWGPVAGNWNFPLLPLRASAQGPGAGVLDAGALDGLVQGALGRAGLDPALALALGQASFTITDLPGNLLGLADLANGRVLIDADAAGNGWFVDSTPGDDGEYVGGLALPGSGADGRVDLLTVVLHEAEHLAGSAHALDGLMAATLGTGERRVDALDAAFMGL